MIPLAWPASADERDLNRQETPNWTPFSVGIQATTSVEGLVLLAEYALKSAHGEDALALYFRATHQSDDPEIAKRTALLARQFGSPAQQEKALDRWEALDPNDIRVEEARLITALEANAIPAMVLILTEIIALDPDYNAQWLLSLWERFEPADRTKLTGALQTMAEASPNASLAIMVAELLEQRSIGTGITWLESWQSIRPGFMEVSRYRAQKALPDRILAISILEQAPSLSNDPDALAQLARWIGLEGDPTRAMDLLKQALEIDPSRDRDRLTLALILRQEGDDAAAETHLKTLLARETFRADAYFQLGDIATLAGQFDLAIDRLLRVDRGDSLVLARQRLADVAVQTNQPERAMRWLAEARRLFPEHERSLALSEAQFHTQHGDPQNARVLMDELLTAAPDDRAARYTRALASAKLDDVAGGEADLRILLAERPDDADTLNALGYTLADQTDRFEEAHALIAKALVLDPTSAAILDSMGWVLFKLGRLDEALVFLERAWNTLPDHEIAAHYGEVLWALGRTDDAQRIWSLGYESMPDSAIIRATVERLVES